MRGGHGPVRPSFSLPSDNKTLYRLTIHSPLRPSVLSLLLFRHQHQFPPREWIAVRAGDPLVHKDEPLTLKEESLPPQSRKKKVDTVQFNPRPRLFLRRQSYPLGGGNWAIISSLADPQLRHPPIDRRRHACLLSWYIGCQDEGASGIIPFVIG
jgi:hypothetical protein